MRRVLTFFVFMTLIVCTSTAQELNSFAGVWTRTQIDDNSLWGNIKISVVNGKLDFQIKNKKEGIVRISDIQPSGNKFSCTILDEINKDAIWKLGHWKNDPEIEILAFYHDGSKGTNFEPSRIHSRTGTAKAQRCSYHFECELENGNLNVWYSYYIDYLSDHNTVLFEDHTELYKIDTYTNW